MPYSQTWNLDTLFKGGSTSAELKAALQKLNRQIQELNAQLQSSSLDRSLLFLQDLEKDHAELESFLDCLIAQNIADSQALQLSGKLKELHAQLEDLSQRLYTHILALDSKHFEELVQLPSLKSVSFTLKERYEQAQERLSSDKEELINQLSIDGYHGWNSLYSSWMGQVRIPLQEQEVSVGQSETYLAHPNRQMRKEAFSSRQAEWKKSAPLFAHILNHLAGFRLKVYDQRQWKTLKEPLDHNRMDESTLNIMWDVVIKQQPYLHSYLKKKEKLLGLSQLSWYDLEAPLAAPQSSPSISYQDGAQLIIDEFSQFSPRMGAFAKRVFEKGWVEAEDRPGKLPGGFCTSFPQKKESRIFMTYNGTWPNLVTLAHELGHAYHNELVQDLPFFSQQYRMNVAETASTMAEMIVLDAAFRRSASPIEKLSLLDTKLQRSVTFLMNIYARFLFETRFYEKRKEGFVLAAELCQLMVEAQKEAYQNSLAEYHPYFWIDKLHFYITKSPFYNFPYTFGYLFSLGLYARALKDKERFVPAYDELLRQTGQMRVEELAKATLAVDLHQPTFWQEGLELVRRDIELYQNLQGNEIGKAFG